MQIKVMIAISIKFRYILILKFKIIIEPNNILISLEIIMAVPLAKLS
jgi:hypothetical protein